VAPAKSSAPVEWTVDRFAPVALEQTAADGRRPLAPVEQERRVRQLARGARVVVVQVSEHDRPDRARLNATLTRLRNDVLARGDAHHEESLEQGTELLCGIAQHARVESRIDQQCPALGC
jgi:hypothetical protein